MSKVPITINCLIYPKNKTDAPYPATLVGQAWISDLEVGGGPMPGGPGGDLPPPPDLIIWGPGDPRPTLPIAGWDPGTGTWPKPPEMPSDPSIVKPPPPEGGWGWSPQYGWGYFPPPGTAGPKK